MFNGTEVVFARANLKSKWDKTIGGLKYVNSQSIDNFMFEIEKKELEDDINIKELELIKDFKNIDEINEITIKPKFDLEYNGYLPNKIDDFNEDKSILYKDYSLFDLILQNKSVETNSSYNFTDYKLWGNLTQTIDIKKDINTITKIWFNFEKPIEITTEDLYLISQTEVTFEIGLVKLIKKPFSMCIIENLLQEYNINPKDNILKICLIDFKNLCESGLPQLCLTFNQVLLRLKFASKSIEKYSKYITYVVEGYHLLTDQLYEYAIKHYKFTIISSGFAGNYKLIDKLEYSLTNYIIPDASFSSKFIFVNTCAWITICFNVNSELLQINKVGLSANNCEYLYCELDDIVVISFGDLTFCNIILDPAYKNKDKFVKLVKNKIDYTDIRGVNLASPELTELNLKIDCNVNTKQEILFNVYVYGFEEYKVANGYITNDIN